MKRECEDEKVDIALKRSRNDKEAEAEASLVSMALENTGKDIHRLNHTTSNTASNTGREDYQVQYSDNESLTLLHLPNDVLTMILNLVSKTDAINLCSVNKSYRDELAMFVFSNLKAFWHQIIQDEQPPGVCQEHCRQIRVVDFYPYGEWQLDVFAMLSCQFPRASHVLINSANSSNWMKYRCCLQVKSLTLYYEKGHNETQELLHEPNLKNIHKLTSGTSGSPKVFAIDHLHDFTNLTTLLLSEYHFNWSDDMIGTHPAPKSIRSLTLINCTWEYPFTLGQFNTSETNSSLVLKYTNNHPFVLLERFNKFLETPSLGIGPTIELFTISFEGYSDSTWRKLFLVKQFEKFDLSSFPRLRELNVFGVQMNLESYSQYVNLFKHSFFLLSLQLGIWEILKKDDSNRGTGEVDIDRRKRYTDLFVNTMKNNQTKVSIELI